MFGRKVTCAQHLSYLNNIIKNFKYNEAENKDDDFTEDIGTDNF